MEEKKIFLRVPVCFTILKILYSVAVISSFKSDLVDKLLMCVYIYYMITMVMIMTQLVLRITV